MAATYRLTREARADLVLIAQYSFQQWGKRQRTKYMSSMMTQFALLAGRPDIGRMRDDIAGKVRSLAHEPYVIFYRARRSSIEILRVIHMSRDVLRIIKSE
jgi:toxin ParE1/3/4